MKFQKRQWSVVGSLIIAVCSFPFLLFGPALYFALLFEGPIGSLVSWLGFRPGNLFDLGVGLLVFCIAAIVAVLLSFLVFLACRWTNVRDEAHCPKCESDLGGNVLPICPECGEKLAGGQNEANTAPKPGIPVNRVDDPDPMVDNRQD